MTSRKHSSPLRSITLDGLTLATPQVLGGVRLVPLLRDHVRDDLRLVKRDYHEDIAIVNVDRRTDYYSYVPHALVASWTTDGSPAAAFGTQIGKSIQRTTSDGKVYDSFGVATARVLDKMRRREDKGRLRFLPLHVSMEGFLALHFGGPDVAWEEYSRSALVTGLSQRTETAISGRAIVGLEDALRLFEIHRGQVGVLVFVADALASAFVTPHPDDYRALHETLVTDFYGELLYYYGIYATENEVHPDPIDPVNVESIEDLREELSRLRAGYDAFHSLMGAGLLDCPIHCKPVYTMGPFSMDRFMTELNPKQENHIGEYIVRGDGTLEYLKTYRLSAAQCRRAYLLQQLAQHRWSLEACAKTLGCDSNQLIYRLEKADFGYLLHTHVLDAARRSVGGG